MRLLVCGGRMFGYIVHEQGGRSIHEPQARYFYNALEVLHAEHGIRSIIHGDAPGADTLAKNWALYMATSGVSQYPFPADWKTHGKSAGPIRNKQMLDISFPDMVVAFPGGPGTNHMVTLAKKADVKVVDLRGAST